MKRSRIRYFASLAFVLILAQENGCTGEQTEYDCVPVNEGNTDRLICEVDVD